MGFEKQSFLFYFVGASAMLLCVLLLPAVCGIYAYLIGLGASFTLTALCNLAFLRKKCSTFQKGRGQVRVERIFTPLLLILPITLCGKVCDAFLSHFTGEIPSLILSALLMSAITFALYLLCGFITLDHAKKYFSPVTRKIRSKRKNEGF